MNARQVAVPAGSLVLGFSVGVVVAELAFQAEMAPAAGLAAGLGLGVILAAFVRD